MLRFVLVRLRFLIINHELIFSVLRNFVRMYEHLDIDINYEPEILEVANQEVRAKQEVAAKLEVVVSEEVRAYVNNYRVIPAPYQLQPLALPSNTFITGTGVSYTVPLYGELNIPTKQSKKGFSFSF